MWDVNFVIPDPVGGPFIHKPQPIMIGSDQKANTLVSAASNYIYIPGLRLENANPSSTHTYQLKCEMCAIYSPPPSFARVTNPPPASSIFRLPRNMNLIVYYLFTNRVWAVSFLFWTDPIRSWLISDAGVCWVWCKSGVWVSNGLFGIPFYPTVNAVVIVGFLFPFLTTRCIIKSNKKRALNLFNSRFPTITRENNLHKKKRDYHHIIRSLSPSPWPPPPTVANEETCDLPYCNQFIRPVRNFLFCFGNNKTTTTTHDDEDGLSVRS